MVLFSHKQLKTFEISSFLESIQYQFLLLIISYSERLIPVHYEQIHTKKIKHYF